MSEEIKETLDWTLEYLEGIDKTRNTKILTTNEANILLDYITNLQQKIEQLEKENIRQKEVIENLTTMTVCGDKKQIKNTAQYKLEQLESIRKEAIEYIKKNYYEIVYKTKGTMENDLLNILNKGDKNE